MKTCGFEDRYLGLAGLCGRGQHISYKTDSEQSYYSQYATGLVAECKDQTSTKIKQNVLMSVFELLVSMIIKKTEEQQIRNTCNAQSAVSTSLKWYI